MRLKLSVLLMGIADTMDSDKFHGGFNNGALSISVNGPGLLFCDLRWGVSPTGLNFFVCWAVCTIFKFCNATSMV